MFTTSQKQPVTRAADDCPGLPEGVHLRANHSFSEKCASHIKRFKLLSCLLSAVMQGDVKCTWREFDNLLAPLYSAATGDEWLHADSLQADQHAQQHRHGTNDTTTAQEDHIDADNSLSFGMRFYSNISSWVQGFCQAVAVAAYLIPAVDLWEIAKMVGPGHKAGKAKLQRAVITELQQTLMTDDKFARTMSVPPVNMSLIHLEAMRRHTVVQLDDGTKMQLISATRPGVIAKRKLIILQAESDGLGYERTGGMCLRVACFNSCFYVCNTNSSHVRT